MIMWRSLMVVIILIFGKKLCQFAESACMLGKVSYADGEIWKFDECVNCTCNATKIECVKETCPTPMCKEPKILPDVCCPFCEDFPNLPPTVKPEVTGGTENGEQECIYDGYTYRDGEVFTSNSTGIVLNLENQCVNCICTRGDVLCYLKTCDIPKKCKKWLNHSDSCCPKCADDVKASLGDDGSSVSREQKADHDCLDTRGEIHRNGSEWIPQVSRCVSCSCLDGDIDCVKLTCPTDDQLPCKNPRRRGNDCCKSCRKKRKKKVCLKSLRRKNKKNKKKTGKRRSRKKDRKNRKQSSQTSTTPEVDVLSLPLLRENILIDNLTIPDFYRQMCMPRKNDHIVYKYVGGRYLFVAFDDAKLHQVEVWRWRLKQRVCDGSPQPQTRCKTTSANIRVSAVEKLKYPSDHFRKQVTQDMIVGVATKKHVKSCKRKLQKSLSKCSKRGKCKVKMVTRAFHNHIEVKSASYNCNC